MRAALLVASFLATVPAAADTPDSDVETAKRLYDAGREAHQAGKYLSAIHAFEGALKITRRPSVLFATAQAYRRQFAIDRDPARLRRALELYREVIAAVPDGSLRHQAAQHVEELQPLELRIPGVAAAGSAPAAPETATDASLLMLYAAPGRTYPGAVGSLDGATPASLPLYVPVKPGKHALRVEAPGYFPLVTEVVAPEGGKDLPIPVMLEPRPARLTITAPAGARILIDGREVATAPLSRPLELLAGTYSLAVLMKGRHADERTLIVHRGEARKVDVSLRRTWRRYLAYGVLGLSGFLAIGGVYAATEAGHHNARADELENKLMSTTGLTEAEGIELNDHVDQSELWTASAVSTFSLSLIGAGIAAWLWFGDEPKARVGPPALITPRLGPGEAGASLVWSF